MIKLTTRAFVVIFLISFFNLNRTFSQKEINASIEKAVNQLKLRSIGPALMGGRISDIEVHPTKSTTWYVSAGSGNVWKTTNAGITWQAIFDDKPSYSIGDVAIDPNNPNIVWIGTGENVSGRHVGWGDGVYKSMDSGKTWKNMGLKESEHIGKIMVDPRNSDVVFVAAEGPLWSSGGERGLYKSIDGGKSWSLVLEIDENTGVTDIEFDPSNPDIVYAAAYQRRRQTWSFLGGGPKSGIYKSLDNGSSWRQVKTGLPSGDVGKIGLGVTPANNDLVYATIEAADQEKGLYRSMDKGESWEKRSSYISGGTGPHYYQELAVSSENPDLLYQMDVFMHVSRDGGKIFNYLGTGREKHSDNHAFWIDPNDGNHLLAGTDAGLYESFDEGSTWRHFPNMPISQFYKLGLDNSLPFYNIVGGAQDLGTLIGPSRTTNVEGVRNQDWFVPLGADGYDSNFDPEDPNIAYMEYQQGVMHRYDRQTNEVINIQPQAENTDDPERWNWDTPLLVSPHNHKRLYMGSQRLWKSEDRGDSWEAISEDLTTNTNRYTLKTLDRVWSVNALYDNGAMSKYATLTSISESPKLEGLLYTGSDDGMIQVSEDSGTTWRKTAKLPNVPDRSFINDIEASCHDANTVFAIADAHKFGNYSPLMFISEDRGSSWKSIAGDMPDGHIVWVLKQDHEDENLLFAGTEFGLFFSYNKGQNWIKLGAGVPTISFRDLELHSRDSDLVGATFGRGFYVLDDYSALRKLSNAVEDTASTVFSVRDAWWYVPNTPMQAKEMPTLGSTSFVSPNPAFGATISYYLKDLPSTKKENRKKSEKSLREKEQDIPFPGWEELAEESLEQKPRVLLLIKDDKGEPVRWINGKSSKGFHRVNWDLRLAAPNSINLSTPSFKPPWAGDPQGPLVAPGDYMVELFVENNGMLRKEAESGFFKVKPIPAINLNQDFNLIAAFKKETSELMRDISSAGEKLSEASERLRYLKAALIKTPKASEATFDQWHQLNVSVNDLRKRLWGDPILGKWDESNLPGIGGRVWEVAYGHWGSTQMPTQTFIRNIKIASEDYKTFENDLGEYFGQLESFESEMNDLGAPFTKGRK